MNILTGLLDTGSHVTIIGIHFFEAFDWGTELIEFDSSVLTPDGTSNKILVVLFLAYEYNGKKKIIPTMVVPIVMEKPIFGIDSQLMFDIELAFRGANSIIVEFVKPENLTLHTFCHRIKTVFSNQ